MIANLSTAIKGGAALLALSLIVLAATTVKGWYDGDKAYAETAPQLVSMTAERDELSKKIVGIVVENGALKLAIQEQNAALALAQEQTRSAEAQQAQARAYADNLAKQKDRRIRELEAELDDPTKTVTDVLDSHWRRHAN